MLAVRFSAVGLLFVFNGIQSSLLFLVRLRQGTVQNQSGDAIRELKRDLGGHQSAGVMA